MQISSNYFMICYAIPCKTILFTIFAMQLFMDKNNDFSVSSQPLSKFYLPYLSDSWLWYISSPKRLKSLTGRASAAALVLSISEITCRALRNITSGIWSL